MGHDISAYKMADNSIAYLRRSMGCEDRADLYHALDVYDYAYGGVSGNGCYKHFYVEQIDEALVIAKDRDMAQDIIAFLKACKKTCGKNGSVIIYFG